MDTAKSNEQGLLGRSNTVVFRTTGVKVAIVVPG